MNKTLDIRGRIEGDGGKLASLVLTVRVATKDDPDAYTDPKGNRHTAVALTVRDENDPLTSMFALPFITDDVADITVLRDSLTELIEARS